MLPDIATKKSISVNGRAYPIIEAGEGTLVVCLHGFPDNYETYQHQIEPFVAAGYRIVCPMMPGYVPGTRPSSGANTPVYAASEIIAMIEGLLDNSDEKKCHLVGHDWGALISYMVANERPDLLYSLAALSIPYNVNLQRVIFHCPRYIINSWYVTFFQLKGLADWIVKRNNWKLLICCIEPCAPPGINTRSVWHRLKKRSRPRESLNRPSVTTAIVSSA
jgi:pimeloyl-ACP methyl ester carboxylesterase